MIQKQSVSSKPPPSTDGPARHNCWYWSDLLPLLMRNHCRGGRLNPHWLLRRATLCHRLQLRTNSLSQLGFTNRTRASPGWFATAWNDKPPHPCLYRKPGTIFGIPIYHETRPAQQLDSVGRPNKHVFVTVLTLVFRSSFCLLFNLRKSLEQARDNNDESDSRGAAGLKWARRPFPAGSGQWLRNFHSTVSCESWHGKAF